MPLDQAALLQRADPAQRRRRRNTGPDANIGNGQPAPVGRCQRQVEQGIPSRIGEQIGVAALLALPALADQAGEDGGAVRDYSGTFVTRSCRVPPRAATNGSCRVALYGLKP